MSNNPVLSCGISEFLRKIAFKTLRIHVQTCLSLQKHAAERTELALSHREAYSYESDLT